MNIGAILIGLAMLLLTIPFLAGPFRRTGNKEPVPSPADLSLDDQRKRILLALRDLEFDYQLGQVAESDYTRLRRQWIGQAGELLQKKERAQTDLLEALIQSRRAQRESQKYCSQCGKLQKEGDQFCSRCGAQIG